MECFGQSLILSSLNPAFQHLPVETTVHDNQLAYYQAVKDSTRAADLGIFIDFVNKGREGKF